MGSDLAIQASGVTKCYRLGTQERRADTLVGAVTGFVKSPWRNFQRLNAPVAPLNGDAGADDNLLWALRDVSFEVKEGDVVGLIGRNGAGKSTLLKILSQIVEPTRGQIDIYGRVASLLEAGTGFHAELTGRENVYLNGTILGMTKREIDRKFDGIVDFSGVERFIDTAVKHYSSGMQVRLAFAVAAHLEPEILVIDEVLAVGDAAFQKKCLGKMQDVASSGRTILFVSHNMIAVRSLCRRGIVLGQGRVEFDGDAAGAVDHYLGDFRREETPQSWERPDDAPGNETLRLRRVAIAGEPARQDGVIAMSDVVRVETEYWIRQPGKLLHVTYHLINHQGVPVLTTGSRAQVHATGRYFTAFRIPGGLLNSGGYSLKILVVENENRVVFQQEDIATFTITDLAERQHAYWGREHGVVQPALTWESHQLPDV
ncbi:MAG TPA: polysaccharide ABC transporter ATP-binding protein [Candidatus Didemnitutus sp.]|nr:polysaccharide ABC transporter ATP-binding protein [Candidatus Didemnitutus sp.]